MDTIFPPITNYYRKQREMKKTDTQIQTPTKQRETIPRNPTKPIQQLEIRNPANNQ
jgi:hypothetical protein